MLMCYSSVWDLLFSALLLWIYRNQCTCTCLNPGAGGDAVNSNNTLFLWGVSKQRKSYETAWQQPCGWNGGIVKVILLQLIEVHYTHTHTLSTIAHVPLAACWSTVPSGEQCWGGRLRRWRLGALGGWGRLWAGEASLGAAAALCWGVSSLPLLGSAEIKLSEAALGFSRPLMWVIPWNISVSFSVCAPRSYFSSCLGGLQ